jgi:excisionase family DNA binding protein
VPLARERFQWAGLTVESADFERLVIEAVERVLPRRPPVDARDELSRDELGFLADAGVDLMDFAPRDRGVASPLAKTAADYAALLATSLTVSELADRLGVDVSRVRQRLTQHTLYGIKDGKVWRIPRFQLDDAGQVLIPGLHRVAPHWVGVHPIEVMRWFTLPHVDLAGLEEQSVSPRDWLLTGGDFGVIAALAEELRGVA